MSKRTREFIEQVKAGNTPSLAQTFKEIKGDLWNTATEMFNHGRTELAAALFAGHAHVMYMNDTNNENEKQQGHTPEQTEHQQDMGRDI